MELGQIDLFKSFSAEDLESFRPIIQELEMFAGDTLFLEGEPGDALFIISEGSVRVFKTLNNDTGEEKSLALLDAGKYIGEMSLMDGTPRAASARIETHAHILKISREDFMDLLRSNPDAAGMLFLSFMRVVSDRLRHTNQELVVLYEVGKIISRTPPLSEMLSSIIKVLLGELKVKSGVVFAVNEFTGRVEVQEAAGEIAGKVFGLKFGLNEGVVGLAISENETINIRDLATDAARVKKFGFEKNHMLISPLTRKEKPFGVILLAERADGQPFDNADVNLVSSVSSQASAAIEAALLSKDKASREQFERKSIMF